MRRTLTAFLIAAILLTVFSPLAKADEVKNFIKLNEPKDNLMTSSSRILLAGETVPNAKIVVLVMAARRASHFLSERRVFS